MTNSFSFIQGLTNWGKDAITTDFFPDDDSLQFVAFFSVCEGGAAGDFKHEVTYGGVTLTPTSTVVNLDPTAITPDVSSITRKSISLAASIAALLYRNKHSRRLNRCLWPSINLSLVSHCHSGTICHCFADATKLTMFMPPFSQRRP
jgi:hypothetical protein